MAILVRAAVIAAILAVVASAAAQAASPSVIDAGAARFEVLTPTLIRLEYAQDGRFENRPHDDRRDAVDGPRVAHFTVRRTGGDDPDARR